MNDIKTKRLLCEYNKLRNSNFDDIYFEINDNNLYQLDIVIKGSVDTPHENGFYHIVLILDEFPIKAPDIKILTPNGRFAVNKKICIDGLTRFHNDTWSPAFSLLSIIESFRSFMNDTDSNFIANIISDDKEKKNLAEDSIRYCLNNETFVKTFKNNKIYKILNSIYTRSCRKLEY